ncbi:GPI mannosyltransferase 2 isoform X2 [Ahaetulla prasina]|uniref:GPI mannosyltransferase 2 isoform X2 n=1 Tax=Ahaetulla prasina TaxID=499056 RepID=UPI00264836CA|nr:GPI mannosyltransferase 2 isoform X2 [Ahaetulla prasina]
MPLRNCRDTRCQEVVCFAVLCRIVTLLLQVLTRFLGSSSPVLYWFCAHLLYDKEPLLQDGRSPSQHRESLAEKPSVANFFSTCSGHENPVLMLLSKWKQNRILTKCILGYVLSYWLLGLVLHCNFFPWT